MTKCIKNSELASKSWIVLEDSTCVSDKFNDVLFNYLQTSEKPEVSVACTPHSVAANYRDDDQTLHKVRPSFISQPFTNQIYVMTDLQQNIIGWKKIHACQMKCQSLVKGAICVKYEKYIINFWKIIFSRTVKHISTKLCTKLS